MNIPIDSKSVGSEVITETGVRLGWLKQIKIDSGNHVYSLVLSSVKISPWFSWASSSYEIPAKLTTYIGDSRILVSEGAKEQISNLEVGWVEKIGFGCLPWHQQNKGHICLAITSSRDDDDEGSTGSLCLAPRPRFPSDSGNSVNLP